MTERGSSTFIGLTFMIIFTLIGLQFLKGRLSSFEKIKQKKSLLLCSKEVNGEYSSFINTMEITNMALKSLTIGKTIAILIPIPGLNIALKQGGEAAVKILKFTQVTMYFSLMKYWRGFERKGCKVHLDYIKTPYRLGGVVFQRNTFNQTRSRGKKKWVIKISKGRYQIKSTFKIPSGHVSSRIREGIFFSRFL